MIPLELENVWEEHLECEELLFLADHGGGWPDCLTKFVLASEDRLHILHQMGFQVAEQYDVPSSDTGGNMERDDMEPCCRLTNGIAVNLTNGFVSREKGGGESE